MKRQRIGLVSAEAERNWEIQELVKSLNRRFESGDTLELLCPGDLQLGVGVGAKGPSLLAAGRCASRFDAVFLGRMVAPGIEPEQALNAARSFELLGIPCLNRVGPMLVAQDKLWSAALLSRAGVPTPECVGLVSKKQLDALWPRFKKGVAKPVFGSGGEGIFRCEESRAKQRLEDELEHTPYLLQPLLEPVGRDFRLFVVGGLVAGAIERRAQPGEWRANSALGASCRPFRPSPTQRQLAVKAAQLLQLEVAGVDLLEHQGRDMVLEVNGFPRFRAIYEATGQNMAEPIAERLLQLAKQAALHRVSHSPENFSALEKAAQSRRLKVSHLLKPALEQGP